MASRERELLLVKLGGSLITDKAGKAKLRPRRLARLAGEIASARDEAGPGLLIGHGSGSFGHVAASAHGFAGDTSAITPAGIAAVQAAAAELHGHVLGALRRAGVPAFSLAPSSFVVADDGRPRSVLLAPLLRAVQSGLVPVVYGDVVMDRRRGAVICSTEAVLLAIARRLRRRDHRARAALWFGDTDGVLDESGRTLARLDPDELARLLPRTGGAATTDVTGGMRHRLETAGRLSRLGIPSWILDGAARGAVAAALRGAPVGGTHVPAAPSGG